MNSRFGSKTDGGARSKFGKTRSGDKSFTEPDIYPLKMNADKKTEMYVKFAKVLLIFQGPVTEKRRQAVTELVSKFKSAGRVVSDDSFQKETSSVFADYKVDDFYRYFKSRVKRSMEEGYNLIVIDQSMTNMRQLKYYCYLAQKMQYLIMPFPPLVDNDLGRQAVINQAVKFKEFSKQYLSQPNYFKHLFCGWFLHDIDSAELRREASLYVQDCFDNIPDFKDIFSKFCPSDFRSFYNMIDKRQDMAFCTAKIFQNLLDTKSYMSSEPFSTSYGKMSKLYVCGFIISPHMIAARVRLTHEQKKLWEMADDLVDDEKHLTTIYPTELLQKTKVNMPDEEVNLISSKSNRTIIAGEAILEPLGAIHHLAKGRSCHILLGKANDAPLRNVNYDAAFAIFRERNVTQKYSDEIKPYDLDRCLVRRIGKYWIIYLKETLIVNGLFASCSSVENT